MESSKNVDIPPVIKVDVEKRLARVFVYLRQHERKAKLSKKVTELNALRDQVKREASSRRLQSILAAQVGVDPDQETLEQELFEDQQEPAQLQQAATKTMTHEEMEREIEELRKTINFKDFDTTGTITASDLGSAFRALNRSTSKADIQWLMWEVDDDLDGCIDWDEFRGAYARGIVDKQGTEPNQFFHLIQFLLSDPDGSASVSVADLRTELQRIPGTQHLITKVEKALGAANEQQELQKHALEHYLDAMLTQLPKSFNVGSHFPPK